MRLMRLWISASGGDRGSISWNAAPEGCDLSYGHSSRPRGRCRRVRDWVLPDSYFLECSAGDLGRHGCPTSALSSSPTAWSFCDSFASQKISALSSLC